ncbi:MAG: glycosyltransferase family 39 protein [Paludibaculum sp.]
MFHLLLLGTTVPLLWRVGRQLGLSGEAAAGAAALYALSPIVGMSGVAAYNDAGGVFFTVAVFALLVEDWREPGEHWLVYAGLAAGFCYAVKITGLLVVAAALAWILWKRRWRGALWFSIAALVSILPWMLRDLVLTGNPVAPLGNRLFANDAFHIATEESLGRYLRDYGVAWRHVPWSITVDGSGLQGLIGPVFLLLPVAFLAWKKPAGRALLAAAVVLTLPWTQNLGARFLMPALAFYALALAAVLPRQLLAGVVVLHAVSAWPGVMNVYSSQWAWRLKGMPWEAALGRQSEDAYLTANLYEYSFLKKAAQQLKADEPLLDLYGLPYAYLPTVPIGPLPSAAFDNMAAALDVAAGQLPEHLYSMRCEWPQQFIRGVRLRMEQPYAAPWSISEAGLVRNGQTVKVSRNWFVRSWPEQGDAWLAVDGNKASRWQSWSNSKEGMTWELRVDRPVPVDGVWALMANIDSPRRVGMYVQGLDRQWRRMSDRAVMQEAPARMYRRSAALFVKNAGYRWIAVKIGPGGHGAVGESMAASPDAWGVDLVEFADSIGLFRIR